MANITINIDDFDFDDFRQVQRYLRLRMLYKRAIKKAAENLFSHGTVFSDSGLCRLVSCD